ncbi:type 1 glutamine amidotransferase [Sunxiuqinia dokdonensis]|nr:type 1 glutamine amidotransferase [Sunxiuqinia dokdonensis]
MKKQRIHCLQHVPFEGLGYIESWIKEKQHHLTYTHFYEDQYQLPALDQFDWLIVMGGPMGVYDFDQYPWLKAEKNFIEKAIFANKTVLGICLGSQLIASALGTKIFSNDQKEIGWFEVQLTPEGKRHFLFDGAPETFKVFHWHGDTYKLPEDATHLALSAACANQAFAYSDTVLGLQFHLEITPDSLHDMLEAGESDLITNTYVQSKQQILADQTSVTKNNELLIALLNKLDERSQSKLG